MTHILEYIYYKLPILFQNLALSLFGLHWYKRRYGGVFKTELVKSQKREFYSRLEWDNYQEEQLRSLLLHALKTVPYYQKLFSEQGITIPNLKAFTIDQLPRLPLLVKDTFRRVGMTELLSSSREPHSEILLSSGSTGTPTQNLYSLRMHQTYYAIFENRILNWAGLTYKVPRGVIGGRHILRDGVTNGPYYRYNWVEHQTYFSAYHLSPKTVMDYVDGIKKNKVEYLTGYASANFFLARFIEEAGIEPPKIKAVLTSADKLTREMRETFRRVYGCETFDSYNGVEVTCLVSECEHHNLHIAPDVGIIEILNEQGEPCQPGETGEVVTTGLLNYNQPLIRYRMGDLMRLSVEQSCACGRHMPIVDEILGRIEDTVIGFDGREMVRFHSVFYNIPSIIEGQIIQNTLTDFEILLVVYKPLTKEIRALIRKRMNSQLGDINLKITEVDYIPRNANGKFMAVISKVERPTYFKI